MTRFQTLLTTGTTILVWLTLSPTVSAQVKPYFAFGTGAVYSPFTAEYEAPGFGSLVGNHNNQGFAVTSVTPDPFVLDWESANHIVTAENGDEIYMSGGGQVFLDTADGVNFTAVWLGHFEVTGGTGDFAKASTRPNKPLLVIAVNDPFVFPPSPGDLWTFDWVIAGRIKLR